MDEDTCVVEGCGRIRVVRGYCRAHYNRVRRTGDPGGSEIRKHSGEADHGTLHGYRYHGCRCDLCCEFWKAYHRGWYAKNKEKAHHYDRKNSLKSRYGMTVEDYNHLLESQGGGCAICGLTEPSKRMRYLPVDHDHETGAVRGILCTKCNQGIGHFLDDPKLLREAALYLERTMRVGA